MQAIRVGATGGPEELQLRDVDDPRPGPGEVLVRVTAAGLNFIDVYHRTGRYTLDLPTGIGLEGAGVVEATGRGVRDVAVGDRVAWADALGSYAELHTVAEDRVVVVPAAVPLEVAAAAMRTTRPWSTRGPVGSASCSCSLPGAPAPAC